MLPSFCPHPRLDKERERHSLGLKTSTLHVYLKGMESFHLCDSLFLSFQPQTMGKKVSTATLSRWLRGCISKCCEVSVLTCLLGSLLTLLGVPLFWLPSASLGDICREAIWSSLSTFVRHYWIDVCASAKASFGWKVLQPVVLQ